MFVLGIDVSKEKLDFLKKMNEFYMKNVYFNEKVKTKNDGIFQFCKLKND